MHVSDSKVGNRAVPEILPLPSLRLNVLWSLLGLLVYNGCQFCLIVVLTRLGDPQVVGTLVMAMAVCVPFQIIGSQLISILATDVRSEFSFQNYLVLNLGSGLLLLGGALLTSWMLNYDARIMMIVLVVAAARALDNISYLFLGFMQRYERMDLYSGSLILKGGISLGVFWVLFSSSRDLLVALLGLIGVGLVMLIGYDAPRSLQMSRQFRLAQPGTSFRDIMKLSSRTAPLSLSAMLVSLNTSAPRLLLEQFCGLAALGRFGAMAYVLSLGDLLAAAGGRALAPRLARHWQSADPRFSAAVFKVMAGLAVFGLGAVFLAIIGGSPLLNFIFGPEYALQASVFTWLTVAMGLSVMAQGYSYIFVPMGVFHVQAVLSLATLVITLALCTLLIPPFGLLGTSWAICVGQACRLAASYFLYRNVVSRNSL